MDSVNIEDLPKTMQVIIEDVVQTLVSTSAGVYTTVVDTVSVNDGALTIQLLDAGGTDPYAVINAIIIA